MVTHGRLPRFLGGLSAALLLAGLGTSAAIVLAGSNPDTTNAAAAGRFRGMVLAGVSGEVSVSAAGSTAPAMAILGRRLQSGDVVQTAEDASAQVYLGGGRLLVVPGGRRVRLGEDVEPDAAGLLQLEISAGNLQLLEDGLRRLSEPGEAPASAEPDIRRAPPESSDFQPLSPRNEIVLEPEPRPRFFWSGSLEKVRVVVAGGEKIVISSLPIAGSMWRYPPLAPPLQPGTRYEWWIATARGTKPITGRVPFRVASPEAMEEVSAFEAAMRLEHELEVYPALGYFLLYAYYAELEAWTLAFEASHHLPRTHCTKPFSNRTQAESRLKMDLGPWHAAYLGGLQVWLELDI